MAWGEDHDEESSLMEDEEQLETPTEDHCILLIDARPSMLKPAVDGGKSPLVASLEAAQAVLRRIIIQGGGGQRNKVGIMLFGAEQEPEEEDEDEDEKEEKEETSAFGGGGGLGGSSAVGGQHFMLQPLAPPTARRIKQLERLCKPHVDAAAQLRLRWPELEAKEEDGGLGLVGIGGTSPLSRALRTCLRTLETGSRKVDRDAKRIWLFTDEDDPSSAVGGGGGAAGEAADPVRQGIKDALDSRAEVRLFYFPPPAPDAKGGYRAFREKAFYGPLLAKQALDHAQWEAGAEEWDDEDEEGGSKLVDAVAGGIERLKEEAGKRAIRKRRYARMALHLSAPGAATATEAAVPLQVALYKTVQPARKPAPLQLAAATNRRLVAATRYLSDTLVKYVDLELEARHALPFTGGDHDAPGALLLDWAKADFEATKRAGRGEQGIHLLGFVPAAELAWELSVGGPTLLYPEESLLKGCTRAFIALREAMLQRKVMALVRFHATPRSEPRMAVLLAHLDSQGLELIKLPFLDDVRSVVVSVNAKGPAGGGGAALTPSGATVAAAAVVVRAVLPREEDFKPHEVLHNPALVKFYSVLEALALEEEGPDVDAKEADKTLVQWEKDERAQVMLQRAAPALEAWEAAVSEECQGYVIAGGGSKKKAAAGGGGKKKRKVEEEAEEEEDEWGDGGAAEGKGKKKVKKGGGKKRKEEDGGDEEEGDTVDAVRAQIADGSIHGLTVPELKGLCKKLGVPVSGKKADLVTRLQ